MVSGQVSVQQQISEQERGWKARKKGRETLSYCLVPGCSAFVKIMDSTTEAVLHCFIRFRGHGGSGAVLFNLTPGWDTGGEMMDGRRREVERLEKSDCGS